MGFYATEPYVYSALKQPFIYSSWMFGLICYYLYHLFGVNGVIIAKSGIITLTYFVLLKDSLRPYKNHSLSIIVLIVIVIISRHRFTERPDTVAFLFLAINVFALNAFFHDGKKYLYILPVVNCLWANCHSSINLMFVPFIAFLAGGLINNFLQQKEMFSSDAKITAEFRPIIIVFLASICSALATPYFFDQFTFGSQFLHNNWFKQNVIELFPPTWRTDKSFFIFSTVVIASFLVNFRRISIINILLLLPVLYLAFTARRFQYYFFILAGPILVYNLSALLSVAKPKKSYRLKMLLDGTVMLAVIVLTTLTLKMVSPFGNIDKIPGFGINTALVPEGALQYMDRRNIDGRVFNSFHWGQYIIWRDFPKRSVIIDGRGNVPVHLFNEMSQALMIPSLLDVLQKTYGFEALLINYDYEESSKLPPNAASFDAILAHPDWALVYWDDNSLLYVRRDGKYSHIAREDAYTIVKPVNNISLLTDKLSNEHDRNTIITELNRNISTTGSIAAYATLGSIYNQLGRYHEAIDCFANVHDHPLKHYLSFAYTNTAYAYEMLGDTANALVYYKKSNKQKGNLHTKKKIEQLQRLLKS